MGCSLHFNKAVMLYNNINMNKNLFIVILVIAGVVWAEVQSCTSCGSECQSACGTRHFRTCCFNYLKKRNLDPQQQQQQPLSLPPPLALDPSLRLELWLARTRNPLFQQQYALDTTSMDEDMSKEEQLIDKEHDTTS